MSKIWIVLVLAGLVAGCQSYRDGNTRTVGQFTDDVVIQTAVKTKLVGDKEIKGMGINVEVSRSIVSLYGRIPSEYARSKALRLASEVKGVIQVVDRLTLVTPE